MVQPGGVRTDPTRHGPDPPVGATTGARGRRGDGLPGSIVALAITPAGPGVALGGYLAGRRTTAPLGGALTGGLVGLVAVPAAGLVSLDGAGAIDPIGYHEGVVRVGVSTAAPGTFAPWQEVGSRASPGASSSRGILGGLVAGLATDAVADVRAELNAAV